MMGIKALIFTVALVGAQSIPARAQPIFDLNRELPWMALHVCASPDAARERANSLDLSSREPFVEGDHDRSERSLCAMLVVKVSLRSPETRPFNAWTLTYSPGSKKTFKAGDGASWNEGKAYVIPYSFTVQRTMFYLADVRDQRNNAYTAWVAVPDRPYMVDYFLKNPR